VALDEGQRAVDGISRRSVLRGGLLAGAGVATVGAMSAVFTGTAKATASPQYDWGYCEYCATMWWTLGQSSSACADTSNARTQPYEHAVSSGSYNYGLYNGKSGLVNSSNPQPNWHWCSNCQGLFWGGDTGVCASGGADHIPHVAGGTNYDLYWGSGQGGQAYWRWCGLCSLLYWQGASGSDGGYCPSYPTLRDPDALGPHAGGATVYDIGWAGTY
jgi:hypothetical protein